MISIDGMDCETEQVGLDHSAKWYLQKKNTSGLTNEISCAIYHDKFLWLRGPFRACEMKF